MANLRVSWGVLMVFLALCACKKKDDDTAKANAQVPQAAATLPGNPVNAEPTPAAAPAPQTLADSWVDGRTAKWKGEWDSKRGIKYDFILDISRAGKDVEGKIHWTLTTTPPGHRMAPQVGKSGDEYVKGTIDLETGALDLKGYKVSDPKLLGKDTYHLMVTPEAVSGRTKSHGKAFAATFVGKRM